jgi:uncharacterized membrane protein YraQ (UPF0718 family)
VETKRQKLRAAIFLSFILFVFIALVFSRIIAFVQAPFLSQPELQGLPLWLIPIMFLIDYWSHAWSCMLFAFVGAGLIYEFIPKGFFTKHMGSSQLKSYLIAVAIAPLFTVCSCTMVPLFAAILYSGAGIGPAIAFLLMAPAANFMTLLLTGDLIGWDITIVRLLASLITAIATGFVVSRTKWGKAIEHNYASLQASKTGAVELVKPSLDDRLWGSLQFSWQLAKQIIPYFLIGLIIVSYFIAFVPETLIILLFTGVQGVVIASIIGGPLYTPTLIEIVVGRALLDLGASRGALLSWLMGQPYDIPNMVAASRIIQWKVVLTYALLAFLFSVFFGLIYSILTGWV